MKADYRKVKAGSLLISEPFSRDPYFRRSVVLIVEHDDKGDVGFILNKCITLKLYDLVEGIPEKDYTLCLGGPVHPATLHYIHAYPELRNSVRIADGLYWGGDFDALRKAIFEGNIYTPKVKFFLGYSGWSRGQLCDEVGAGGWGIADVEGIDIFSGTCDLWSDAVELNEEYNPWLLVPENPSDN